MAGESQSSNREDLSNIRPFGPDSRRSVSLTADLSELLAASELSAKDLAAMLRAVASSLEATGKPAICRIVPFTPGRRPTDEIDHPGLGSSDSAMFVLNDPDRQNVAMILFDVDGLPPGASVEASILLESASSDLPAIPLPGWNHRQLDIGDVTTPGRHRN